jgi:arylsulfatase A-like enzyme
MPAQAIDQHARGSPTRLTDFLALAAWAGFVSGLLEATESYLLRFFPAILPYMKPGIEVFWVAPVAYAALLELIALPVAVIAGRLRKVSREVVVLGALAWIGCYAVISYPRVIAPVGVATLSLGVAVVICRGVEGREQAFLAFLRRNLGYAILGVTAIGAGTHGWPVMQESFQASHLPAVPAGSPNVLVIVIDTLRADRLSSVGYSRPTTPHIDQARRDGVLFENAFATGSWTLPSHNSMLTGRFTYEHGMDYPVPNLRHGFPYLPEVLARHGYKPGLFSANLWQVVPEYLPAGFLHCDTYTAFSTLVRTSLFRKLAWQTERFLGIHLPPPKRAVQINHAFLDWVDQPRHRPFFALLNYIDVHDHFRRYWALPSPYRNRFGDAQRRSWWDSRPATKAEMDLHYDEALAYVDGQVGWLLDQLRARGLDRSTLVVITSDHGEALLQHGELGHNSNLYREQIQVPLIFRFPGKLPSGIRPPPPVSLAARPSTIRPLLGLPNVFPGKALPLTEPQATENPNPFADPTLAEYSDLDGPKLKSLVTWRWHYILNVRTGQEELFDFQQDREELHNLAGAPESRLVLEEFRRRLRALLPRLPLPHAAGKAAH